MHARFVTGPYRCRPPDDGRISLGIGQRCFDIGSATHYATGRGDCAGETALDRSRDDRIMPGTRRSRADTSIHRHAMFRIPAAANAAASVARTTAPARSNIVPAFGIATRRQDTITRRDRRDRGEPPVPPPPPYRAARPRRYRRTTPRLASTRVAVGASCTGA